MYKVLIADDEMIIRTELEKAFDWNSYGMEVVGLAKNGFEAITMVEALKPDICLLDINMPIINGLELIQRIAETNKNIINVIISGYDEFQYAQKAIQLGVYEYVLKPIEEDLFIKMLMKIKIELDQTERTRNEGLLSSSMMEESKEQLKNEFFMRWIYGEKTQQGIQQGFDYFGIKIPPHMGLLLIKLNIPIGIIENEKAKLNQITECKKVLSKYLNRGQVMACIELKADSVLLFVDINDVVTWNSLGRKIEQELFSGAGLQVKTFASVVADGVKGVPSAFKVIEQQCKTDSGYLPMVKKIKHYVEKNYEDSQLRLQNFADENKISISYLSKIFKQETGVAFIDYLIKFRIMKSLELLEQSSLKISNISEMVGYSSQHYYCEAFKKVMGMAPTEYRKRGNFKN